MVRFKKIIFGNSEHMLKHFPTKAHHGKAFNVNSIIKFNTQKCTATSTPPPLLTHKHTYTYACIHGMSKKELCDN
jgi:hypothetical protein